MVFNPVILFHDSPIECGTYYDAIFGRSFRTNLTVDVFLACGVSFGPRTSFFTGRNDDEELGFWYMAWSIGQETISCDC
jgi:hypothetical protein